MGWAVKVGRWLSCILVCTLLALLPACQKTQLEKLPADWPIPQLTLPSGAVITEYQHNAVTPASPVKTETFLVTFSSGLTMAEVQDDVAGKLTPLNYTPQSNEEKRSSYVSPDGKIRVLIRTWSSGARMGQYSLLVGVEH